MVCFNLCPLILYLQSVDQPRIICLSIQVLRVMSQSPTHLLLCTQSHSNIPIRVHPILKVYHITHVLQIHPILQVQPILFILPVCLIPLVRSTPLGCSIPWVRSTPLGCSIPWVRSTPLGCSIPGVRSIPWVRSIPLGCSIPYVCLIPLGCSIPQVHLIPWVPMPYHHWNTLTDSTWPLLPIVRFTPAPNLIPIHSLKKQSFFFAAVTGISNSPVLWMQLSNSSWSKILF